MLLCSNEALVKSCIDGETQGLYSSIKGRGSIKDI